MVRYGDSEEIQQAGGGGKGKGWGCLAETDALASLMH